MRRGANIVAVVLNWRDPKSTRDCVDSLLQDEAIRVIHVVDNESSGELREIASERVLVHEQAKNLGFSRGVNVGLRESLKDNADAVLVINNDAVLAQGAIVQLLQTLSADDSIGLVAPVVINPDGSPQSTGGRFRAHTASTTDRAGPSETNYLTWACVLIPRNTLARVGLLDEAFFMYWEDVDYGLRVTDEGLGLKVVDSATVVHAKSASHSRAGSAIDTYSAHGLVVLARKRRGVLLFVGMPLRIIARLFRRLAGRRFDGARAVIRGVRSGSREVIDAHEY